MGAAGGVSHAIAAAATPEPLTFVPTTPRPLLIPALAFAVGIWLADALHEHEITAYWPVLAGTAAFCILAAVRGRSRLVPAFLTLAFVGGGFVRYQSATHLPPTHVAHITPAEPTLTRIAGEIVSTPVTRPGYARNPYIPFDPPARTHFLLMAESLDVGDAPTPLTGLVRVSVDGAAVGVIGERVQLTGKLWHPSGPRNPGERDWRRWNMLQGIYAGFSVSGSEHIVAVSDGQGPSRSVLAYLRARARGLLLDPSAEALRSDADRLLDVLVLGQRSSATPRINDAFVRTGTAHYLAVSGFHIGVLAWVAWWLGRFWLRRRAAAWFVIAMLLAYALVTEPTAPVVRATTMGIIACVAVAMDRPFSSVNWLSASALVLLAWNPLELFRPGFQLSFVVVFVLLTFVSHVHRWRPRHSAWELLDVRSHPDAHTVHGYVCRVAKDWTLGLTLVSVVAWLGSLPLLLHHFGRFAPLGFLHSMLVAPLVILAVPLGLLATVLGVVPWLRPACDWLLESIGSLLLSWVELLGMLPGGLIETSRPPAWIVSATYVLILAPFVIWRPRPRPLDARQTRPQTVPKTPLLISLTFVGSLWLGWWVQPHVRPTACELHVLAVGNGSANLLVAPGGRAAVFDAGTITNSDAGNVVAGAAGALHVRRLDLLTISHSNFDHFSGVPTLVGRLPTERIVTNPYFSGAAATNMATRSFLDVVPDQTPRASTSAGDTFMVGDVKVDVLWPPSGLDPAVWRPNDRSLVLRVETYGRTVIIPGDIERDALRALLNRADDGEIALHADVLIAPHHGSVVAPETARFLEAVAPSTIIVSSGDARPFFEALARDTLGDDCRILITRDTGAVVIRITPDGKLTVRAPM